MQPLEVYYDGLCHLCSREVDAIRRLAPAGAMRFVDIAADGFDAGALGLDAAALHRHMHVRDGMGTMRTGLDALIAMWRPVPYFHWLAMVASLPGIYRLSKVGYAVFARVRPWLPRRKCAGGTCDI